MPTYLRPGVYIEEFPPRDPLYLSAQALPDARRPDGELRPVKRWAAEHGIAAFLGIAEAGPVHTAVLVNNWKEFESEFRDPVGGTFLWYAVRGFFANGGKRCYVVRINSGDVAEVTLDDIVGNLMDRTGLGGLEAIDDISVIAAPDLLALYHLGIIDLESVRAAQLAMIAHGELTRRLAILDPPGGLSAQQLLDWRRDTRYDSSFAALYYPWLRVLGREQYSIAVPPSGHLAGMHARTDIDRHVANDPIHATSGVELDLAVHEQEVLNPMGVNVLFAQPGRGLLAWGARTLSSDPAWRYLRARRLMNFIARNIRTGTAWAVFERSAHDPQLWDRVREELEDLLSTLWRTGAARGDDPEESYSVKCDLETNPAEMLDSNVVTAECAIALSSASVQLDFRVVYFLG